MRDYELMYVIAPNFGDDDACAAYAEQLNTTLTNNGVTLTTNEIPYAIGGRRKLAYPLRYQSKDVSEGYYVTVQFAAPPTLLTVIERELRLAEPVIRHLVTLVNTRGVSAKAGE